MKTLNNSMEAGKLFNSIVKGKNFMTPHVLGYYQINNGAAELTTGDFMGNDMFGVTIVKDGEHQYDLSKCFDNKEEATEYIYSLT